MARQQGGQGTLIECGRRLPRLARHEVLIARSVTGCWVRYERDCVEKVRLPPLCDPRGAMCRGAVWEGLRVRGDPQGFSAIGARGASRAFVGGT